MRIRDFMAALAGAPAHLVADVRRDGRGGASEISAESWAAANTRPTPAIDDADPPRVFRAIAWLARRRVRA